MRLQLWVARYQAQHPDAGAITVQRLKRRLAINADNREKIHLYRYHNRSARLIRLSGCSLDRLLNPHVASEAPHALIIIPCIM